MRRRGMKKRLISGLIATTVALNVTWPMAMAATSSGQWNTMSIYINGTPFSNPYEVAQSDGTTITTYIPIFYVNQALSQLGFQMGWNGTHKTWAISTTQTGLNLPAASNGVGNTEVTINGVQIKKFNTIVKTDPASGVATTYVPIYYLTSIFQILGLSAKWDGVTRVWSIVDNGNSGTTTSTTSTTTTSTTTTGGSTTTGTSSSSVVTPTIALQAGNGTTTNIIVTGAQSGANLTLYTSSGSTVVSTLANTSGTATFYNVGTGTFYVTESVNGATSEPSNEVTVSATSTTSMPSLSVGSSNGTWYIAVNNAAANATATLYSTAGSEITSTTTNQYGYATFDNVSSGNYYVVVSANGQNIQSNAVTVNTSSPTSTGSSLTAPVLTVSSANTLTASNVQAYATVTIYTSNGTLYGTLTATSAGIAALNNVAAGSYYAVQSWNGSTSAVSNTVTVGSSNGITTPYLSANGNVLTVSNLEANATVKLYTSSGAIYATLAASSAGEATWSNAANGSYYAVQTWDGITSAASNTVTVGSSSGITTPYLSVSGSVLTVSDLEANSTVTLYTSSGAVYATLAASSSGVATWSNAANGSYYAVQTWDGYTSSASNTVTVGSSGSITTPVLSVTTSNSVNYLTVSNLEANASVTLYNSNGTYYGSLTASSSGTASWNNVATGSYYAVQTWDGYTSSASNTVTVGSSLAQPNVSVSGNTILVTNVEPSAQVTVFTSSGGVYLVTTASTSGTATFTNVAAGYYYVTQNWDGSTSTSSSVYVS